MMISDQERVIVLDAAVRQLIEDNKHLTAEVDRLKGIITQHHEIGYMQRAVKDWGNDCEICKKHKVFSTDKTSYQRE